MSSRLHIAPEIDDALRAGRAVVALETAVLTHGLPRTPHATSKEPTNLHAMRLMIEAVREGGAVPAVIAVMDGGLHIGLHDNEVAALAADETAGKATASTMAAAIVGGGRAGTTVSATLIGCTVSHRPIRVLATGGIGGVHRSWHTHPDISADLRVLASTPLCVVCSGVKSILDVPATLAALETLGVPLIAFGTDDVPLFLSTGSTDLPAPQRLDTPAAIAEACRTHWQTLGRDGSVVIANPPPVELALEARILESHIDAAEQRCAADGVHGPDRTPMLLAALNEATGGLSVEVNVALLRENARLAAAIAGELAGLDQ